MRVILIYVYLYIHIIYRMTKDYSAQEQALSEKRVKFTEELAELLVKEELLTKELATLDDSIDEKKRTFDRMKAASENIKREMERFVVFHYIGYIRIYILVYMHVNVYILYIHLIIYTV